MTQPIGGRNRTFDWATIATYLSLVTIGWFMLYSIFYNPTEPYDFIDPSTDIGKQTIWVGLALASFILILSIEWTFWNTLAYPIYAVSIILLILVLLFGTEIKGARSWFTFGGVSFQPSEIAKFGTALALSSYMSFKKHDFGNRRTLLITLAIFFLPTALILLQPDAGSAIVFLSFFLLLYRKGFSPIFFFQSFIILSIFILTFLLGSNMVLVLLWFGAFMLLLFNYKMDAKALGVFLLSLLASFVFNNRGIYVGVWMVPLIGTIVMMFLHFKERNIGLITMTGIALVLSLIFMFSIEYGFNNYLKPHQQDRINAWLQPEKCDRSGSLYNIIQSKLAIGSGGTMGKGFLNGEMTKLKYVPEQSTDFIFSTVGEEQGFIGVLGVILLFTLLIIRLIIMAERARLEFIRNYLYCIAGILFIHFFINIGMTMGVMPVIGIPLPFMSKGGSSLLSFSIMLGVAIKMDYYRFR
jgi:rod shape determining protein RodA